MRTRARPPRSRSVDIALIYCFGNPVAITRKVDPDVPIVLEQQRIDAWDCDKPTRATARLHARPPGLQPAHRRVLRPGPGDRLSLRSAGRRAKKDGTGGTAGEPPATGTAGGDRHRAAASATAGQPPDGHADLGPVRRIGADAARRPRRAAAAARTAARSRRPTPPVVAEDPAAGPDAGGVQHGDEGPDRHRPGQRHPAGAMVRVLRQHRVPPLGGGQRGGASSTRTSRCRRTAST